MTTNAMKQSDIIDLVARLKAAGEPFALATVVRTVSVTAAKAGAKAVIRADGRMSEGWIGGGCARGAVLKAARDAMEDGAPRLISVQPDEALAATGVKSGDIREGVKFARNMCPSKGTMDVFIEAVLPAPECVVCGTSPVAVALADLAPRFGFSVTACAPATEQGAIAHADRRIEGYALDDAGRANRFAVVATQGRGDEAALRAAIAAGAGYTAFVGSRAKLAALKESLIEDGVDAATFDRVKGPAGLDIGAITPEEIALSILAEMVAHRRSGQRQGGGA